MLSFNQIFSKEQHTKKIKQGNKISAWVLLFSFSILILSSCASTRTSSYSDPDFIGKKYKSICVFVEVGDLQTKKMLEEKLASELKDENVDIIVGGNLFSPTRTWSSEQINYQLKKKEIEGYLLVQVLSQSANDIVTGTTTVTDTKQGTSNNGKQSNVSVAHTSVNSSTQYLSSFKTQIIDVESNRVAYIATSNSESEQGFSGDFTLILNSFASDIIKDIKAKGHL